MGGLAGHGSCKCRMVRCMFFSCKHTDVHTGVNACLWSTGDFAFAKSRAADGTSWLCHSVVNSRGLGNCTERCPCSPWPPELQLIRHDFNLANGADVLCTVMLLVAANAIPCLHLHRLRIAIQAVIHC